MVRVGVDDPAAEFKGLILSDPANGSWGIPSETPPASPVKYTPPPPSDDLFPKIIEEFYDLYDNIAQKTAEPIDKPINTAMQDPNLDNDQRRKKGEGFAYALAFIRSTLIKHRDTDPTAWMFHHPASELVKYKDPNDREIQRRYKEVFTARKLFKDRVDEIENALRRHGFPLETKGYDHLFS